ncbi:MAG: transcription antitermination factor NusB [Prevotellaceae bacterium]|nr:transcription antitermination factor NusB [Candidatus Faecinaster equi]
MINRELIRIKVVQLVYANFFNQSKSAEDKVKELNYSLASSYEMYQYLLLLIPEITEYAKIQYEIISSRSLLGNSGIGGVNRFLENRFAAQLAANTTLLTFKEKKGTHSWTECEDVIKNLYNEIIETKEYTNYIESKESPDYEKDRSFWYEIYSKIICNNEKINAAIEGWNLYWNDDKFIIDSFVLKTIAKTQENLWADQPLLSAFKEEDNKKFAKELFVQSISNIDEYEELIGKYTRNWDIERLPVIELSIMLVAVSEIMNFQTINPTISINEYLNICKYYCDSKSVSYINAILDKIVSELRRDNKIFK